MAAAGAAAAIYTFVTRNVGDVLPVLLTMLGLGYEVVLGLSGMLILLLELRYWRGARVPPTEPRLPRDADAAPSRANPN